MPLILDHSYLLGNFNKFKNCWYRGVRIFSGSKALFQQFLNLSSSQRHMSGPILGDLSSDRRSGVIIITEVLVLGYYVFARELCISYDSNKNSSLELMTARGNTEFRRDQWNLTCPRLWFMTGITVRRRVRWQVHNGDLKREIAGKNSKHARHWHKQHTHNCVSNYLRPEVSRWSLRSRQAWVPFHALAISKKIRNEWGSLTFWFQTMNYSWRV